MMKTSEPRQTAIRTHSTEEPPLIRWLERSPYLHEARVTTTAALDAARAACTLTYDTAEEIPF